MGIRIKTYWDFSGLEFNPTKAPSISNVMGLFPDENINWYQKLTCDDPKPSLSFCLPIVATVAKGRDISISFWLPRPTSTVGVLYLFVCRSTAKGSARKIKVISTTQKNKKKYFIYIFQKTPHRHPPPPLWKGQGSQDAPRGSHRFCSESVKYHLHAAADRHPPFKNDSSASRKDTLLHLILSLLSQASAKWILYQGYIFHYKILVFYILHIRHYYLPLPIPYYKTYVIHGIIAHKQTNLFLWLEYVF